MQSDMLMIFPKLSKTKLLVKKKRNTKIFINTICKSNKESTKLKKKLELWEKKKKEKSKNLETCKRKPPIDKLILTPLELRDLLKKVKETQEREKCLRMKREQDCWLKWKLPELSNLQRENQIYRIK